MSGMQVIAWDPAQETIRSWTYDSDGGFGEETWSQSGNRYTIRAKYTLPDGGTASALHVLTLRERQQLHLEVCQPRDRRCISTGHGRNRHCSQTDLDSRERGE